MGCVGGRLNARAIIHHLQAQVISGAPPEAHLYARGVRVSDHIGERLLRYAKHHLRLIEEEGRRSELITQGEREPRRRRAALKVATEGVGEAEGVELRGAEVVGEGAHLLYALINPLDELAEEGGWGCEL